MMVMRALLITCVARVSIRGERDEVTRALGRGLFTGVLWFVCYCYNV